MPLKSLAKRSLSVHGTYKLWRDRKTLTRWSAAWKLIQVLPNTMLPIPRLIAAYDAIQTIDRESLGGDVVECGVWNGGCIGFMAMAHQKRGVPRRKFHLFDSFEGVPQPSSHDIEVLSNFRKRNPTMPLSDQGGDVTAIGKCVGLKQPQVEHFLANHLGLSPEEFVFHVGWFQDTVPKAKINQIALLRLDGDWYESTKVCLDGLFDRVVPGGFVIIDDYGAFSGCRKAVDDFFAQHRWSPNLNHTDQHCVYCRKALAPD